LAEAVRDFELILDHLFESQLGFDEALNNFLP
jgi:hypothetical protein